MTPVLRFSLKAIKRCLNGDHRRSVFCLILAAKGFVLSFGFIHGFFFSLLLSFTSDTFEELSPTIGVDFKVKHVTIGGKKLKLAIWDTAGQERFRTLTSSYYRGAQGIIMVYDVTRRDTFTDLSDIWAKEIDLYSTNQDCIKMLVGNKVDKEQDRVVTKKEGMDFAREYGCLFIECSAKTRVNVEQCFEELVLKILDTPSLTAEGSTTVKRNIFNQKPPSASDASASGCC
ncbi:unnamed protein product [Lactuca virosa]|uniref:Ras-related protein RABC1 n=1 Tax=Lactuca virosa TaxID=75947 RepID=A0AAU9M6M7_9ASTR|nr:unnamed protein product [Lactuca virosa]